MGRLQQATGLRSPPHNKAKRVMSTRRSVAQVQSFPPTFSLCRRQKTLPKSPGCTALTGTTGPYGPSRLCVSDQVRDAARLAL